MGGIRLAALWQSDGEDIQHMHDMTREKQLESEKAFTDEIPFKRLSMFVSRVGVSPVFCWQRFRQIVKKGKGIEVRTQLIKSTENSAII